MLWQEVQLLREAVFPYLLCTAAREGSIEALERMRQAVSKPRDLFTLFHCCSLTTSEKHTNAQTPTNVFNFYCP